MNPPSVLYLVYSPTAKKWSVQRTLADAEADQRLFVRNKIGKVTDWRIEVYHRRFEAD